MADCIRQTREIPVTVRCDTAVIGGGPAGLCAAISAARSGLDTVLAERYPSFGGTATMGFVNPISGFFQSGQQVAGGIAWELVERMQALDAAIVEWPKGHVSFHPETYKLVAQRMLLESGVRLMTGVTLSGCMTDGGRVTHAVVEGKSGPEAIGAKCFIDATGEADLCRLAGAPMMTQDTLQPLSLCFVLEGVDTDDPLMRDCIHHTGAGGSHSVNQTIHDHLNRCMAEGEVAQFGGPWFNTMVQGSCLTVNVTRRAADAANRADMTRAECLLREDMHRIVAILRRDFAAFRHCALVASGVTAGVRETARILGVETVTGADMLSGRAWDCPAARCAHPMDRHSAGSSEQSLQYFDTAAYVPHTAMIPRGFDNLLAAGRCVSADAAAYASLRVQATVMALGESAGLMAAQHIAQGVPMAALDPAALREAIRGRGIIPCEG